MKSIAEQLIEEILTRSGRKQADLCDQAGIPSSSISRAKARGKISLDSLESLAKSAGLRLCLCPAGPDETAAESVRKGVAL